MPLHPGITRTKPQSLRGGIEGVYQAKNVRFGWRVQPIDALTVLGERMECLTIRRGYFRGFTAAEQTGTLRSLASDTTPWD